MVDKYQTVRAFKSILIHTLLIIVAVSCIFPLLWTLSSALKTQETVFSSMSLIPDSPQWHNFIDAWIKGNFGIYFFNSLLYTIVVVGGIVVISSLAAFAFSKLEFFGRQFFFLVFLSTMMLPLPATFVPLYSLINKFHWINTRAGYIFPQINTGLALAIFLLKTFFDKTPSELEDSARIDGCGKLGIYLHVAIPLAKPAIAVVIIFNTLNVWNEFFWANLVLNSYKLMPLQRGLIKFQGSHLTDYPLLMAAIVITVFPIIVLYLMMQKHIIKGIAAGALKG